jgi:flavin-dependent dehydrogenase
MDTIDLLIIGTGPAGLSTALHLLQQDPSWAGRMLLLEKAVHPRPKLCGGGVTRLGLCLLRDLGLPLPLPIPQARVDDVRLQYGSRCIHARGYPQFVVFHRPELDNYLADQARKRGAVICENEPVISFNIDAEGVTVTTSRTTYRAKALVAADGSKGIARQTLERGGRRRRVARLLETFYPAPEDAPHFNEHFALFDFTPARQGLQGYCWEFPARLASFTGRAQPGEQPAFNRGVYDARVVTDKARAPLPQLLDVFIHTLDGDAQRVPVEGHPIHWFSPRNRLAWPRLLLVGDAAGSDPLFGEGIAPALGYGQVAAQALQTAFVSGDFSFRNYRRQVLASPLGRFLLLRWAAAEGCYRYSERVWFMHLVWTVGDVLAHLWPQPPELYET